MHWWNRIWKRRGIEAQFDAELGFHLEKLIEEQVAAGQRPEEAKRQAILEFGGREQVKEDLRDVHRLPMFEHAIWNLRSGIRLIRTSPSFSIAVILTLALGIGANSAVFSAINAILLRPLPFPRSDELVMIRQVDHRAQNPVSFVAPVRLEDWNRLNFTFQGISGYYTSDVSETSGDLPEKVTEALVAPRFLTVWGIVPALGRDFHPEEEHFGVPNAILISDRFWRRRFQANPGVVGRTLRLEQHVNTIVGVLPASFLFPDHDVDIWTPSPTDAPYAQDRQSTWFTVVGRLKAATSMEQGNADLAHVQAELAREFPKSDAHVEPSLIPLKDVMVSGARRSLWVLFGSVSLLLLIACANIAALLLARTTEREREISVRFSLGASRLSVIGQLVTECFVLALAGGGIGILVAAAGSHWLRMLASSLPRAEEITLDWGILIYTLACAVAATLLSSLFPAIRGTRSGIRGELARASRTQVSASNPLQWVLVGIQVALAVTLLMGAGLLLRSFEELGRVTAGFEPSHVLTLRISGNWGETMDMKRLTDRINRTLEELRSAPGVREAATSATLPGMPSDARTELRLKEGNSLGEGKIFADSRFVSRRYFATMQIPMVAGEGCPETLNPFAGVVVNRSFANTYLRGSEPLGRHLQLMSSQFLAEPETIRGVVADAHEQGLNRAPGPTVYWCVSAPSPTPFFLVRTQSEPITMAQTIRRKIREVEPARSVYDVSPLEQHLSDSFAETRLRTTLLTLFALTAVSLACIGLYGTLTYFVSARSREIGLRLALGALREQIVMHFLIRGLGVAGLGCLAGYCLAVALAQGISGMLYGVSKFDVKTLFSVVLLLLAVAALASLVPSVRAARIDPMRALREE